jgi:glutathione S-transferase
MLRFLIRRAFRVSPRRHAAAVKHVSALLADVESRLADGRRSILGGDEINYTDLAFAAIMGLWTMPPEYGGGKADAVRVDVDRCPEAMQAEIAAWRSGYPRSAAFIERLYGELR